MGQKNSKDESVYQQVIEGNVEAIKALCKEGARLEWIDKEGKTPLIVASMDPRLYIVAKTLIELGANINAYRPGSHAGTPLHHAAKRGLDHTVKLLLVHGANAFARNDDCQTPLDVARTKGHTNVVHAIEAHICYFSGDIREILLVPGILESLVPQRLARKSSKKSWMVVVPCGPPNTKRPPKLELAVYSSAQDPQPRTIIPLWKCNIREPKFHESDPSLTILNESTRTRYKFLSAIEGDRHQLAQLYSACKGCPKVMPSPSLPETNTSNEPEFSSASNSQSTTATNGWDDIDGNDAAHSKCLPSIVPTPPKESCNGWAYDSTPEQHNGWADAGPSRPTLPEAKASNRPESSSGSNSQSSSATKGWGEMKGDATHSEWGPSSVPPPTKASCNGWADEPKPEQYNGWADPGPSRPTVSPTTVVPTSIPSAPSAPPLPADVLDDGPIHYPTIDVVPMDSSVTSGEAKGKSDESGCVICWEAPIEGACIPCGHMAGCISCLSEIKSKKGVCPVCRAKIDQVIRLYAV